MSEDGRGVNAMGHGEDVKVDPSLVKVGVDPLEVSEAESDSSNSKGRWVLQR